MTWPRPRAADPLWYKDAIVYQLHVKSYMDSNGDGIGDFAGLLTKLDYIASLGVNTIWLLPFYPSPRRDDGYDIAEYTGVHPDYGTMADAKRFIAEAHKRKLRVITELVINHTSDQHAWFQRARAAKAGSAARNYYVWSDNDQAYAGTRIIFCDTEKSNWTWDPVAGAYFWHRFFSHQPDLNFDNPQVMKAVIGVMRWWLDLGIDGLRLDAVPYLIEREGTSNENLPETHDILKLIRQEVDRDYPGRLLLAEANMWPEDTQQYFGDGDECHMAFHFPLMPRMYMAIAQEDRFPITDILRQTPDIPPNCQWAIFLRNHDELTLEMVTDKERDYLWNFYAADRRARINLGIRRRLAPLLERDRRRIELMKLAAAVDAGHAGDLLRRRDRHGRQRAPRRPRRGADADAVVARSQRRLLARQPGVARAARDHGRAVRLRRGQRREPGVRSAFAAELDAPHAGDPFAASGLRSRTPAHPVPGQPQGARVPARIRRSGWRRRDHPLASPTCVVPRSRSNSNCPSSAAACRSR